MIEVRQTNTQVIKYINKRLDEIVDRDDNPLTDVKLYEPQQISSDVVLATSIGGQVIRSKISIDDRTVMDMDTKKRIDERLDELQSFIGDEMMKFGEKNYVVVDGGTGYECVDCGAHASVSDLRYKDWYYESMDNKNALVISYLLATLEERCQCVMTEPVTLSQTNITETVNRL